MHGMIFIEVGFHMTMLACGITLTIALLRVVKLAPERQLDREQGDLQPEEGYAKS